MRYVIDLTFLLFGISAIAVPWIGFRRTGGNLYFIVVAAASVICGWICLAIVVSWFFPVMPSYLVLANPVLFVVALVAWFFGGAHVKRTKA